MFAYQVGSGMVRFRFLFKLVQHEIYLHFRNVLN